MDRTIHDMSNVSWPKKIITLGDYSYVVYGPICHDRGYGAGLMSNDYYAIVADKLTEILSNPETIQ
jgi:hypothetical protein